MLNMKNEKFKIIFIWVLAVFPIITNVVFYPYLPDRIPLHWNILGQVDRTGAKFPSVFIMPVLCILITVLMVILPKIDPRKDNYKKFGDAYYWIMICVLAVLEIMNIIILLVSLGINFIPVDIVVKLLVGIMIMILGILMPKIKHNYFVGVRTPWTLASEEVWVDTHRHAGKVFFTAGILMIVLAFITGVKSAMFYFAIILIAAFEPIVHSYLVYRKSIRK